MAFDNFLTAEEDLIRELQKEGQDVREVGARTAANTADILQKSKVALDQYSTETTQVNADSDAAIASLQAGIDHYNNLRNAPFVERLQNVFVGIVDPTKNLNVASRDIQQQQQRLRLSEMKREQSKDKLNAALQTQQATLNIESEQLQKEVREYELVKEEIQTRRQAEAARLQQQEIFLTTRSPEELSKAQGAGNLTKQQVVEELQRRKSLKLSMEQLDMSVTMQRNNLVEYNRQQILDNSAKHQVQAMLTEALKPENGGIWREGNLHFTSSELTAKMEELSKAEIGTVADKISTQEGVSVGRATVEKLARYTGLNVGEMDTADAYSVIAKRADIFNPKEQSLIRQAQMLQSEIDQVEDGKTRAELAKAYLQIAETIQEATDNKVRAKFPKKESQVAIEQQLENGRIDDMLGAQDLMFTTSLTGVTTGSHLYDDMLVQMRPMISQIAGQPLLTEVQGYQEQMQLMADQATNFAYTNGIFETIKLVAADPELADLRLDVALKHPQSRLYGGIGKFKVDNLFDYFENAFGENAVPAYTRFEQKLLQYLPQYANQTFGYKGATPEGAVAISAMNNQLFGNQPVENFMTYVRAHLKNKSQQRWERLAPARPNLY